MTYYSPQVVKNAFRRPTAITITGRISTITNAFVSAVIPFDEPKNEAIVQALDILGMTPENVRCAYCGDNASEWDHLHPIVNNQQPTGYWSCIRNLVPSCGKCNQSKGNKPWKEWINSDATLSPRFRLVADLDQRIKRLEEYERRADLEPRNFQNLVGAQLWNDYEHHRQEVLKAMQEAQKLADKIKAIIAGKNAAFDFLKEPDEDIYTLADGKPFQAAM